MLVEQGDGASTRIPDTVQALIASRIDRLPPASRSVVRHGALIGRVFWRGAVAELDPALDVDTALVDLVDRQLLTREPLSTIAGEQEYRFRHVLIRDVAYSGLAKGERARLHRAFAAWLQAASPDELVETQAYHLDRAAAIARRARRAGSRRPPERGRRGARARRPPGARPRGEPHGPPAAAAGDRARAEPRAPLLRRAGGLAAVGAARRVGRDGGGARAGAGGRRPGDRGARADADRGDRPEPQRRRRDGAQARPGGARAARRRAGRRPLRGADAPEQRRAGGRAT